MVQDSFQLNGTNAHKHSDSATYSTEKSVLQGISVYCEKYNLVGKIDVEKYGYARNEDSDLLIVK